MAANGGIKCLLGEVAGMVGRGCIPCFWPMMQFQMHDGQHIY
jgi:hypothetical protein